MKSNLLIFTLVLLIIAAIFGFIYLYWSNTSTTSKEMPKKIEAVEVQADINGDSAEEKIKLEDQAVYVYQAGELIWQSNSDYQAEKVVVGDINNDQKTEILISLWKWGKYGPDLPFWLNENVNDFGNHLFIYRWEDDQIKLVWGSSTLDAPIRELEVADIDGDEKNDLIVLEGVYDDPRDAPARYVTVWKWKEWNLFNEYRGEQGSFKGLELVNGRVLVGEEEFQIP